MIERWSRDQVLALAPDASSQKAAQGVATPGKWSLRGTTGTMLYGECKGSGAKPYLACVDLTEPAYRCSCPSRKFPCKHTLGLLLLWSADGVPAQEAAPQWVTEWVKARAERAARSAAKIEGARQPGDGAARSRDGDGQPAGAEVSGGSRGKDGQPAGEESSGGSRGGDGQPVGDEVSGRAGGKEGQPAGEEMSGRGRGARGESVRHGRVASGLAELERWLADQVRQGLAGAGEHDWEGLAKRLIDAQAPGVAGIVSRLARVRSEEGWPGRLLEEYALLNLLAVAYRRRAELPPALGQTVLIRTGFPVTREEVLARPAVRDHWDVLGRRDEVQDRLTARKVWLRGRRTGRPALVLSFAPQGQSLDASLVTGTTIDADLAYYPGAAPLRALVAARHGTVPPPEPSGRFEAMPRPPAPSEPSGPSDPSGSSGSPGPSDLSGSWGPLGPSGPSGPSGPYGSWGPPGPSGSSGPPGPSSPFNPSGPSGSSGSSGSGRSGPPGVSPEEALDEVARALAGDPWMESWPLVLAGVVPGRTRLGGLPLHLKARDPWRLIAVSGGRPLTVAVEWTPHGVRPLTAWDGDGRAVIL
ncbi:SWIM zinc finger family protein [Nonomuraea diastatica]|uniref:SWIM zinc finger family protein n=1 Tax=Nonomuraea diastatica TaxID=1848329 RepID=UPI001FE2552F|nr:SWIM zinc finger family protein [Nonomuraea diastatica]